MARLSGFFVSGVNMNDVSRAEIISFNTDNDAVCAASARISTTEGNSAEIFLKSQNNEKNGGLIRKVLASGHRSVIEHAVFTISFTNVSVYVEQFFIESRLASFTVKSRRYVDFSNTGYYIPENLGKESADLYKEYMDAAFLAYAKLLELEIPKEDARFLLPYSFFSNFYCTMNARELIGLINSIRNGRGKHSEELQNIAEQLIEQLREIFPCISEEFFGREDGEFANRSADCEKMTKLYENETGKVELVNAPKEPAKLLEIALKATGESVKSPKELLSDRRPRALEQLSYSFLIKDVTLAGITHIVRHRMQSVIVPPIENAVPKRRVVLPKTVEQNPKAREIYEQTLEKCDGLLSLVMKNSELCRYICYFALSGNLLDVMTTMNARELLLFIRLRACSRAQWEVRGISERMLSLLRADYPELFGLYGPSCYVLGNCPEGRMCCGKQKEMMEKFGK